MYSRQCGIGIGNQIFQLFWFPCTEVGQWAMLQSCAMRNLTPLCHEMHQLAQQQSHASMCYCLSVSTVSEAIGSVQEESRTELHTAQITVRSQTPRVRQAGTASVCLSALEMDRHLSLACWSQTDGLARLQSCCHGDTPATRAAESACQVVPHICSFGVLQQASLHGDREGRL